MLRLPPTSTLFPTRRSSDLRSAGRAPVRARSVRPDLPRAAVHHLSLLLRGALSPGPRGRSGRTDRSEEHTSELQSRRDLVCRLLLEKKKSSLYVSVYIILIG